MKIIVPLFVLASTLMATQAVTEIRAAAEAGNWDEVRRILSETLLRKYWSLNNGQNNIRVVYPDQIPGQYNYVKTLSSANGNYNGQLNYQVPINNYQQVSNYQGSSVDIQLQPEVQFQEIDNTAALASATVY